ncbi:pyridoxamine 5'-phosphate oxidase-domain-containing protein [Xylaria sp. CBS 124048]|nr:pyridoxamine 5'-phosphate oxidase-domain-containing protein [Xylaria sp. CBS 124048]
MKLSSISILSLAITAAEASVIFPSEPISNPPASSSGHRIPTSQESAVLGRRILALTPLGNLATTFPNTNDGGYEAEENRPQGLGGMPHALMEYVADCEEGGNPTFLAINVETTFKNVRDGSNISLAQQWTPPYPPAKRIQSTTSSLLSWLGFDREDDKPLDTVPYSAANLPRFSLLGYLEKIEDIPTASLAECFVKKHPDARYWLPGSRVHKSEFMRLVVQQVYWIGGFGDRAYIGWIPVDEWRNVTREEWGSVSLPGEKKGWNEWSPQIFSGDL